MSVIEIPYESTLWILYDTEQDKLVGVVVDNEDARRDTMMVPYEVINAGPTTELALDDERVTRAAELVDTDGLPAWRTWEPLAS